MRRGVVIGREMGVVLPSDLTIIEAITLPPSQPVPATHIKPDRKARPMPPTRGKGLSGIYRTIDFVSMS